MKFSRRSLLLGTSALTCAALTAAALAPARAEASCLTVNSDTTVSDSSNTCITWDSSNVSITSAGTVSGANTGVAVPTGSIVGNLTNSGLISGTPYGIENAGSVGTITNNAGGTIDGSYAAITNGSIIAVITNSGTITGVSNGILTSGTIASIDNAGGTISGNSHGIDNSGVIGTITNSGTVSAVSAAITNSSSIAAITNSGTVSGGFAGVFNYGTGVVSTIINSGTISGAGTGISNNTGSTIGTISNSGTINGVNNVGIESGGSSGGLIGTISNAGTIIGGSDGIVIATDDSIGSISNSGVITGGSYGIFDAFASGVGTIINNSGGTISGGITGIGGLGAISEIINSGVISGGGGSGISTALLIGTITNSIGGTISGRTGIGNNTGTIGTISNSGIITSGTNFGIESSGTIGIISNSGTISGAKVGILGYGTITTITNAGNGTIGGIAGGSIGVSTGTGAGLPGTIGMIINAGTINGAALGIENPGTIGTITNSGVISGGNIGIMNAFNGGGGTIDAIINNGTIVGLNNPGLIGTGATAIDGTGTIIGTLSNTGTISGNIIANQGLTIAGGNASTIGTLAGGTITAQNLTFVSGAHQLLGDDVNVGSGTVTNSGTIQVNAAHSIVGNYAQGSGALLVVGVTDSSDYGALVISGSANMTGDHVSITGTLTDGETLTIAQASDSGTDYAGIQALAPPHFLASASSIAGGGTEDLVITLSACHQAVNADTVLSGRVCGVTWNAANLSIAGTGVASGSTTAVLNSGNTVGTLTNNGVIDGTTYGIKNSGTIAAITNNAGGTISGGNTGIYNSSSVGAINNSGTISGSFNGIANNGGTIATITNTDLIEGSSVVGNAQEHTGVFDNAGNIGTIINNGTISSDYIGIGAGNSATIASISNTALINGTVRWGINNYESNIIVITNAASGTISGGSAGIYNFPGGTYGTIINSGTIKGGSYGIANNGLVGGGATAIDSTGTIIGAVLNSGTISGNIIANQDLNIVGSVGTLIGGTITANNLNFLSSANQVLHENIFVGSGSGTVTNNGIIQVNNASQSITGNYTQGGTGQLVIGVTDSSDYGELVVSGAAAMSGGHVSIANLGSGLMDSETFTIAQASSIGTDYAGAAILANGFLATPSSIIGSGIDSLVVTLSACSNQAVSADTVLSGGVCGVTWNSSNISITSSGFVAGSATAVLNSDNNVGTLTNNGVIDGSTYGVNNSGSIAAIVNGAGGLISGNSAAIYNSSGTISAITNTGLISGGSYGIFNTGGTIGTITNSGTISSGGSAGIFNTGGSIGAITNSGGIGGNDGIVNDAAGVIGTIANSGAISGARSTGIYNSGASIGTITNSGTISGFYEGIGNSGGTIAAIVNNIGGTIGGGHTCCTGIYNTNGGSIGAITNSGLISGNGATCCTGIYNLATIGTITNSGTIIGFAAGIDSYGGTIGAIINSGLIDAAHYYSNGYAVGIYNSGTIGTIINSGTVSADAALTGSTTNNAAILNLGTIGTITNSGLITGPNAIYSTGTILSAVTNTGTIAGNINVAQDLTITGGNAATIGTLTGYGTVAGTITANSLTFDSAAYQLLDDEIDVGSGTVTNSGALRINATHSITGNYAQGSSALLVVGVTDSTHYGDLIISGTASMAGDHVSITPTSGTLASGETFTIAQAAGVASYSGITATASGGFSASVTSASISGYDDLIVALSGGSIGGGEGGGGGGGGSDVYASIGAAAGGGVAPAVGAALDQIKAGGNPAFDPIFTALNNLGSISEAAEQQGIKELGPHQVTPQIMASDITATQTMHIVGQHEEGLLAQDTGGTPIGQAAGSAYQSGVFWMQVSGGGAFLNGTDGSGGYRQSLYGLTFGADVHTDDDTALGAAVGWMHTNSGGTEGLDGDSVSQGAVQLTGYGTHRFGPGFVDGMLGVGFSHFSQTRDIAFLRESASASYNGMQYMGRIEGGWDFTLSLPTGSTGRAVTLTPLIGLQAVRTDNDGYSETGAGVADLTTGSLATNSLATTLGGKATTLLSTSWGNLTPEVRLLWVHDLDHGPISTNATLGGVNFTTETPRASRDGAEITFAATLAQGDGFNVRAEYDGDIRSDYQSHTGELKAQWNF